MDNRIKEFDYLRTVAILLILFHHLPSHTFEFYNLKAFGIGPDLSWLNDINRYLALGIFMFISGYLIESSKWKMKDAGEISRYAIDKCIRIMPLYYIALALFVFMFSSMLAPMNLFSLAAHILGLQIIMASKYCEPVFTLWYVGLIMSYYLVFIAIRKWGTSTAKILSIALILIVAAVIIHYFTGFIDKKFIIYMPVFIFGILGSKYHILSLIRIRHYILALFIFILSVIIYSNFVFPRITLSIEKPSLFSPVALAALILSNLIMFSFPVIVYGLCKRLSGRQVPYLIEYISYSSYCMFLFHRPVWVMLDKIYTPVSPVINLACHILIGIPIIIVVSHFLQKFYDNFIAPRIKTLIPAA